MDKEQLTYEEVFRRAFPGIDPSMREEVVRAYEAARHVGTDIYMSIVKNVGGGRTKWESKEEENRVRRAVREHERYGIYKSAIEKRDAAVRLIDSWGNEGIGLLEAAGIDVGRFRGDARSAKKAASSKVVAFPGREPKKQESVPDSKTSSGDTIEAGSASPAPQTEERPTARNRRTADLRPGDPAAWYHTGAVIDIAGEGRITVIKGWSEGSAMVVPLDRDKEIMLPWSRLPLPEDRMELSVNPAVPQGIEAGRFGFETPEAPTLAEGSVVQPINALEAEALDPGAAIDENASLDGTEPVSGHPESEEPGQQNPAWSSMFPAARRPSRTLVAAGLAAGIAVLSVGSYFFSDPDVSSVAGEYASAAIERLQDYSADSASGRGPMAKGSISSTENPFDRDKKEDAPVSSGSGVADGNDFADRAPGECLEVSVPVVIDGKDVRATTEACVGPQGELLVGAASRGKAALRGFEIALDEAERRLEGQGLSRRQAVKIADAASKDPGKAKLLQDRSDLSRIVSAMAKSKASTRSGSER